MFFKYLPAVLWALVILVLSMMPGKHLPPLLIWGVIPADKLGHFAVYFLLEILMIWPVRRQYGRRQLRSEPGIKTLLTGVVYGVFIEVLQEVFGQNRAFEIGDILANSLGTATGLVGFIYVYYHLLKRN